MGRKHCIFYIFYHIVLLFRINYRLTNRTKPKSAKATLLPSCAPLPLLNGYSQTLIQNYPKYSQQYCRWLTHGLKVQSVRANPNIIQYNHTRPAPTLVQYLNRPKTSNGRWAKQTGVKSVDFNLVGVQKEMQYTLPTTCTQNVSKSGEHMGASE